MFVATFYSYKGGVGRSLAVANVAAELAQRGRSVLIVDFDLEAPGVTSFDFGGDVTTVANGLGLVDFIESWLSHGQSPAVSDYVHLCQNGGADGGAIRIMPAGRVDAKYGARLNSIDFADLYENHEGFLLFEDLRAQWRGLGVDYVLIDSRTGHTDVGGVCTRQLPDLVVFVFWPNDQNLNGLALIADEIRAEKGRTPIKMVFVPSNLPTLDDEDGLLQKRLSAFKARLGYGDDQEVRIQNYPSLDLLEQTLFTVKRRNSRLGKNYRALADAVQRENSVDEEGVRLHLVKDLAYGRNSKGRSGGRRSRDAAEDSVWSFEALSAREWRDPEIFRLLARLASSEGDPFGTVRMIKALVRCGADNLADNLVLAQTVSYTGETLDTLAVVAKLLDDPGASQQHVVAAINLLAADEAALGRIEPDIASRPAVKNLTLRQLATASDLLNTSLAKTRLIASAIRTAAGREENYWQTEGDSPRIIALCLPLIASGYFDDAGGILTRIAASPERSIRIVFNLAMARWGADGVAPLELLREVVSKHEMTAEVPKQNANYDQCMGLAYGELGDRAKALAAIEQSRKNVDQRSRVFSCWSYLAESQIVFSAQLDQMLARIRFGEPLPDFLRRVFDRQGEIVQG